MQSIAAEPVAHRERTSARFWWAIAWLGIAAAIFLRVWRLGALSLWFDEGYTAWMVSHSPREIIRLIRADTAPPLHYLLLHGWTEIFGRSEAALRSLSVVFSILTLLVAVEISRRMLRKPAAVAAAMWLMALSFMQTQHAREARAYALMGLLGVSVFDCLQRHLASQHRRWLIAVTVLIAAAMYTHNMMAPYALALLVVWPILPSPHSLRRRLVEMLVVALCAFVLYLPWAIFGLPAQMDMIHHAFWVEPLKRRDFLMAIGALAGVQRFGLWADLLNRIHLPIGDGSRPIFIIGCLILASAWLSIFRQSGSRRREAIGLLTFALFPLFFVGFCSVVWTPLFTPKLFMPSATLLPIFVLIPLGMPLSRGVRRAAWGGTILLIALSGLTIYGYPLESNEENWRAIAKQVQLLPPQKRLIIFVANDAQPTFDYYYHSLPGDDVTGTPSGFFDRNPPRTMMRVLSDSDVNSLKSKLASGNYDQIVLVTSHLFWGDPNHRTQALIKLNWKLQGQLILDDLAVEWYGHPKD